MKNKQEYFASLKALSEKGINRVGVLDPANYPGFAQLGSGRLVLLMMGGSRFWEWALAHWPNTPDPLDQLSTQIVQQWTQGLALEGVHLLYPSGLWPLGDLLPALGISPSPLGIGIDPEWGLWNALLAVIFTQSLLPLSPPIQAVPPCQTCHSRPCLAACGAQAVQWPGPFDGQRCRAFRLAKGSPCAQDCPARRACPLGKPYPDEQIAYHTLKSLEMIKGS